ncbi:fatty acid desaturase [Modestobacter sp. VKM Ac-2986]|uniref:fatty acid desaturase n=1 Tax=Modestobacter sp. VKM Ac-2986 TaxID=3004140 RepID=UPI0022AB5646|nr:fatty acid desaturase [Modestobacter sp. VKM Ac-2986]MCZ2829948.1 fatty acid desaturase [Modestobacter sp. VKM Ac-2986]
MSTAPEIDAPPGDTTTTAPPLGLFGTGTVPAAADLPVEIPVDLTGMDADDRARTKVITSAIRQRSQELRRDHPVLRHQDALGLAAFSVALLGFVGSGALYLTGVLPWYVTLFVSAAFAAIGHEVEHDLIHALYFRRRKAVRYALLYAVWAFRPYTINPVYRIRLHLRHHAYSGLPDDIEEVSITNGKPWGLVRLYSLLDPYVPAMIRIVSTKPVDEEDALWRRTILKASIGLTPVAITIWYGFLVLHLASWLGAAVPAGLLHALTVLTVVWVGPNVWRGFCLHFISSNMHYQGDVEQGNVLQQTQVFNKWYLAPFQVFCANFGSTHPIHHFYVADPFYVRQLMERDIHPVLAANGVRFNDMGTFARANRYAKD